MSGAAVNWQQVADALLKARRLREQKQERQGIVRAAARVIRQELGIHHTTAGRVARALQTCDLLTAGRVI